MLKMKLIVILFLLFPAVLFGDDSSYGDIIIGFSSSYLETVVYEEYDYGKETSTSRIDNKMAPFISFKGKPNFILGEFLAIGFNVTYGSFVINEEEYDIKYNEKVPLISRDQGYALYDGGWESQYLSMIPTISFIFGNEDTSIEFGGGYGVVYVETQTRTTKIIKSHGKVTYRDGTEGFYSITPQDVEEYSASKPKSYLFVGTTLFLTIRLESAYFSVAYGESEYSSDTLNGNIKEVRYYLGFEIFSF